MPSATLEKDLIDAASKYATEEAGYLYDDPGFEFCVEYYKAGAHFMLTRMNNDNAEQEDGA